MGIMETAMKTISSAHMASVYKTESDQLGAAVPFILSGLDRGEKVFYVVDGHTREDMVEALMKVRDVQGDLDAHRLEFLTSNETYLSGGRFDPDRMIALVDSVESRAYADGFSGVRGAGEMTWYKSARLASEALMQYEARLNQRYPKSSMNILCQYDETSFDASLLLDAVKMHPRVVVKGEICANPYYIPPEEFLSGMKEVVQKSVFERTCNDILKRAKFSEIHRLELHDMRQVGRRMAVIGGLALDEVQNQLDVLGFYTELALEAVKEPSAKEYLLKMEGTLACLKKRLEFMRTYQMVGEMKPHWIELREALERVYQRVSMDGIHMELSVGRARVFADDLLERALEALVVNVPDMDEKGGKVSVAFSEVGDRGLLSVQHAGRGVPDNFKVRIFECGYRYGRCEGFDLFLASEILKLTGITVRETGVPGKCTRFEVSVPAGKYSLDEAGKA